MSAIIDSIASTISISRDRDINVITSMSTIIETSTRILRITGMARILNLIRSIMLRVITISAIIIVRDRGADAIIGTNIVITTRKIIMTISGMICIFRYRSIIMINDIKLMINIGTNIIGIIGKITCTRIRDTAIIFRKSNSIRRNAIVNFQEIREMSRRI